MLILGDRVILGAVRHLQVIVWSGPTVRKSSIEDHIDVVVLRAPTMKSSSNSVTVQVMVRDQGEVGRNQAKEERNEIPTKMFSSFLY